MPESHSSPDSIRGLGRERAASLASTPLERNHPWWVVYLPDRRTRVRRVSPTRLERASPGLQPGVVAAGPRGGCRREESNPGRTCASGSEPLLFDHSSTATQRLLPAAGRQCRHQESNLGRTNHTGLDRANLTTLAWRRIPREGFEPSNTYGAQSPVCLPHGRRASESNREPVRGLA